MSALSNGIMLYDWYLEYGYPRHLCHEPALIFAAISAQSYLKRRYRYEHLHYGLLCNHVHNGNMLDCRCIFCQVFNPRPLLATL